MLSKLHFPCEAFCDTSNPVPPPQEITTLVSCAEILHFGPTTISLFRRWGTLAGNIDGHFDYITDTIAVSKGCSIVPR